VEAQYRRNEERINKKPVMLIGGIAQFCEHKSYSLSINDKNLLLIHHQDTFFLIENKCGHFGVPLDDAQIKDTHIICAQHGISFSLETGQVVNRPYENCYPIKTYPLLVKNQQLYCLKELLNLS